MLMAMCVTGERWMDEYSNSELNGEIGENVPDQRAEGRVGAAIL
jgi:hypothetical protein